MISNAFSNHLWGDIESLSLSRPIFPNLLMNKYHVLSMEYFVDVT